MKLVINIDDFFTARLTDSGFRMVEIFEGGLHLDRVEMSKRGVKTIRLPLWELLRISNSCWSVMEKDAFFKNELSANKEDICKE